MRCSWGDVRINNRLKTAESRLDIVNSEISNFRQELSDIWEKVGQLNTTVCIQTDSVPALDIEYINRDIGRKFKEFITRITAAFMKEKQVRLEFMHELKEQIRDYQTSIEKAVAAIDIGEVMNKITELGEEIMAAELTSLKKNEFAQMKVEIEDLYKKYETLLAMNSRMQQELNSLYHCASSWVHYDRSCYYLSNERKSWSEAQTSCQEHHARLVEYNDIQEQNFVFSMARSMADWGDNSWNGFWVGADDPDKNGQFKWISSRLAVESGFSNWLPGQPDNRHNHFEFCMMILANQNGSWNDGICKSALKFVCERKILL